MAHQFADSQISAIILIEPELMRKQYFVILVPVQDNESGLDTIKILEPFRTLQPHPEAE